MSINNFTTSSLVSFDFDRFKDDITLVDTMKTLIHLFGSDELKVSLRNAELNRWCNNQFVVWSSYQQSVQNELDKITSSLQFIYPATNPYFRINTSSQKYLVVELELMDILLVKHSASIDVAKLVVAELNNSSNSDFLDKSMLTKVTAMIYSMVIPSIDEQQVDTVQKMIELYIPLD